LLLDEPTDRLHDANVAWLENYLVSQPHMTCVTSSHNRLAFCGGQGGGGKVRQLSALLAAPETVQKGSSNHWKVANVAWLEDCLVSQPDITCITVSHDRCLMCLGCICAFGRGARCCVRQLVCTAYRHCIRTLCCIVVTAGFGVIPIVPTPDLKDWGTFGPYLHPPEPLARWLVLRFGLLSLYAVCWSHLWPVEVVLLRQCESATHLDLTLAPTHVQTLCPAYVLSFCPVTVVSLRLCVQTSSTSPTHCHAHTVRTL
jgi:hypothetical protein